MGQRAHRQLERLPLGCGGDDDHVLGVRGLGRADRLLGDGVVTRDVARRVRASDKEAGCQNHEGEGKSAGEGAVATADVGAGGSAGACTVASAGASVRQGANVSEGVGTNAAASGDLADAVHDAFSVLHRLGGFAGCPIHQRCRQRHRAPAASPGENRACS